MPHSKISKKKIFEITPKLRLALSAGRWHYEIYHFAEFGIHKGSKMWHQSHYSYRTIKEALLAAMDHYPIVAHSNNFNALLEAINDLTRAINHITKKALVKATKKK